MILALDAWHHTVYLAEVENERDAFFEIRRYLEVNNIFSDTTSIDKDARSKRIRLGNYCPSFEIIYEGNADCSSMSELIDSHWQVQESYQIYLGEVFGHDKQCLKQPRHSADVDGEDDTRWAWIFDEFDAYMKDRRTRLGVNLSASIQEAIKKRGEAVECH